MCIWNKKNEQFYIGGTLEIDTKDNKEMKFN